MQYLVKPWEHQLRGIEMARHHRDLALFFEMGTGKTGTQINILREKFALEKRVMRTLILGPLITVKNWQDEFRMHSKIKHTDIIPLTGPGKKRAQLFSKAATDPVTQTLTRGKIFITNYEAGQMTELWDQIKLWQPEILVCDESHRLKNFKSNRAKNVVQLLGEKPIMGTKRYTRALKHCYILSGSPILNKPMDVFNQFRILDSGETFGLNFYEFRNVYFEDENKGMPSHIYFPKFVPRPETDEQLNKKIYRKALRVLKKDCLDLPPLVKRNVYVEMGKEQTRLYEEMKKDFITWMNIKHDEPRAVVAQMALTKALRLQQIVSGFVKTEDGQEHTITDNPRLNTLAELLEDLTPNHKVIVWATFHHNYRQIAEVCKKLGIKYVEIHGGITASGKNQAIEDFRGDPTVRVAIANQGAAGIGVNLVEYVDKVVKGSSSYSIFYSKNFSNENDLQAESRNYRGGSEVYESITRIDLIAPGTIDELITDALRDKQDMAEKILNWKAT